MLNALGGRAFMYEVVVILVNNTSLLCFKMIWVTILSGTVKYGLPKMDAWSPPYQYNAVVHMVAQHREEKIPLDLLSKMHLSLEETDFMKGDLEGTKFIETRYDKLR